MAALEIERCPYLQYGCIREVAILQVIDMTVLERWYFTGRRYGCIVRVGLTIIRSVVF